MSFVSFLRQEIKVIKERDPAIKSVSEVFIYPSFRVILAYRISHKFYKRKLYFVARWISQRAARNTGIEIHPGARIGKGLFIDHGTGVVIGETCIIGNNVTIYQGVTLGGTGKEKGKRHPTIGSNVMISAGAKVLGSFRVGHDSKIGAGSVVLKEIPPYSTVVGIPGRIIKRNNHRIHPQDNLDQVHLPDPYRKEMCGVLARIEAIENKVGATSIEEWETRKKDRCKGCPDFTPESTEFYREISKPKK